MSWTTQLTQLNSILAQLYPNKDQCFPLLDRADIPAGNISFKDAAMDNWYYILKEANRRNKVEALVDAVLEQYPQHEELAALFDRPSLSTVEITKHISKEEAQSLTELVQAAPLKEAAAAIASKAKSVNSDLYHAALIQSRNLRELNEQKLNGTIPFDQFLMHQNKIVSALLNIIEQMRSDAQSADTDTANA